MTVKHRSSVRLWLLVAAIAMAAAFLLTYRSIRQSEISNVAVDHTERTLASLIALEGAVGDLVFASGEERIRLAQQTVLARIDDLATLTIDNEPQQRRLNSLRTEIAGLARSRRLGASPTDTRPEALVSQSLSRVLRDIRGEELQLLTRRVDASDQATRQLRAILVATAAVSTLLVAVVFGLVVRDDRKRHEVEQMLRRTNEELDGRVVTRTAELNDALDRERTLRQHAEATSRLKDEFLMTVSHELRTPLNALLGWADMLRLGIVSDGRRARAAEAIYENAKLQQQLIADLLDTSRILTGKLRIEPTVVDLARIVRDAVGVLAPAAQAKGLALDVAIDDDGSAFVGDSSRLQQIVWNLVSNAVKFTAQGSVSVRLARRHDLHQVDISVADTGIGISQDFLPHVFDRFSQEKTGTTRPHGGLGLGLAIVRQLVELHGGTIHVESEGEGRGSVFTVSLPDVPVRKHPERVAQIDAAKAITEDEKEMPSLDDVRVLVVDDDRSSREMVTAALEHCGAHVTAVASAADARSAVARSAYDLLLVDIAMPGEDGYALIRHLRTQGVQEPAVALTALAHDTDRDNALDAGFNVHLAKPIEAQALALAVARLVRGQRAEML